MIKRTVFSALLVVIAGTVLEYVLFAITVTDSIVRGLAIALGYLASVVVVRALRKRQNRGKRLSGDDA
jgi:Na+-translocating ferredoxin:NAD+ oxidoreductase RnfA subunit